VLRGPVSSRARWSGSQTSAGRDAPQSAHSEAAPPRARLLWHLAPLAVAIAGIAVWKLLGERPFDLAAHLYRTHLFESEGFTLWNGAWYGGHHTPAYSVLFPPLAALVGPIVVGATSVVASAALFAALARERWGDRARWPSIWFAAGLVATIMFTGRLVFGLGVAFALAALLAFQRDRNVLAAVLAIGSSLASPVSGAFLALGALAYAISGERTGSGGRGFRLRGPTTAPGEAVLRVREDGLRVSGGPTWGERLRRLGIRPRGLGLAAAALAAPIILTVAFPEGGYQPFRFGVFWPAPLCALIFLVALPKRERALRAGALLYLVAVTAAFVIDTPMGSNAVRLGAMLGGPLFLAAMLAQGLPRERHRLAGVVAVCLAMFAWMWITPLRDHRNASLEPAVESAYFDPLLTWLDRHDDGEPYRLHIPFSRSHWEAAAVAPHHPLARGWERQLDTGRNRIFYDGLLNPLTYAAWLSNNGVRYVALPSVRPDFSSHTERGLLERGLPYLRLRWRSEDWRVYEFTLPHPLAVPEEGADMRVTKLENDEVELDVRRPGTAKLRVRWSPYWKAHGGCIQESGDWTKVTARRPGIMRVTMSFSPERVFSRGPRCSS
jgi:hypothetical protein